MEYENITKEDYEAKLKLYQDNPEYCEVKESRLGNSRVLEMRIVKKYKIEEFDNHLPNC
jgi:hypothetical protein